MAVRRIRVEGWSGNLPIARTSGYNPTNAPLGEEESGQPMPTEMTTSEWDRQFARQASWTRGARSNLYRRANLLRARRVLDVGSGTGVVTEELASRTEAGVIGVDLERRMVDFARARGGRATYQFGDAHDLPFQDAWFDLTACHFLLMWCQDPHQAVQEMVRVTQPGGSVLICAEPDYGGRIDYPESPLGKWQVEALRREGADPLLGRQLRDLCTHPSVRDADVGLIPGLWNPTAQRREFESEWALWERSLAGLVPAEDLARAKGAELAAIESGRRLSFLPVFFALVRV